MNQQDIINKINKAAEFIHKKTLTANYIIVSPKIAEILENLDIRKYRKKKLLKLKEIMEEMDKNEKKPLFRGFFIFVF